MNNDVEVESIQIHLDSRNAVSYNNNLTSDCYFYFNNRLEIPSQHTIYISVISASIPFSFYSITTSNNLFSYSINSINYFIIITPGNYNAINLISFMNSKLQSGLTCSYNQITNKITFSHTTSEFIINASSTCLGIFGIQKTFSSSSKTLTCENCLNLQTVQTIYMLTNLSIGNMCLCNLNQNNVLLSIPVESSPNSTIVYRNQNNFRNNLFTNNINFLNIRLTDQYHNPLELNGAHWVATLQLDVVDFVN